MVFARHHRGCAMHKHKMGPNVPRSGLWSLKTNLMNKIHAELDYGTSRARFRYKNEKQQPRGPLDLILRTSIFEQKTRIFSKNNLAPNGP